MADPAACFLVGFPGGASCARRRPADVPVDAQRLKSMVRSILPVSSTWCGSRAPVLPFDARRRRARPRRGSIPAAAWRRMVAEDAAGLGRSSGSRPAIQQVPAA